MHPPVTIRLFNLSIHSFHFFGTLGYFLGLMLGLYLAYFTQLDLLPVFYCGLTGAGVLFGLTYLYKAIAGRKDLVYYQHEITILVCCTILLYSLNLPVLKYLDITLMGIGVFLFMGRIGCFSVGCCHGRLGSAGVKYTEAHVAEGFHQQFVGIPVFPIQLVESAFVFATVLIGSYTILNGFLPGTALLIYTVIYGAVRFVLEYYRGDAERSYWLGFSEAQWTTLGVFAVTVILSLYKLLPQYTWHLWALPGLVLLMMLTFAIRKIRNVPAFRLSHPKHILEIAKGLEILENTSFKTGEIIMFTTSANLNVSMGKSVAEQDPVIHYTVSFQSRESGASSIKPVIMNYATANILGKLIQTLKHMGVPFDILCEQQGVFHILFPLHKDSTAGERRSEALNLRRKLRYKFS